MVPQIKNSYPFGIDLSCRRRHPSCTAMKTKQIYAFDAKYLSIYTLETSAIDS